MNKKTIEDQIEEVGEEYKQRLREKMAALMTAEQVAHRTDVFNCIVP